MCGIFASISPTPSTHLAIRALRAMKHRGPDGSNTTTHTTQNTHTTLAHTRLSIIGLDNGTQPIHNEDHTISIVVNGELYDFAQHRTTLQHRGHTFRTDSDSEIALHLYEEHGLDFLQHLRGEFSLILLDTRTQRLIAARDRFGVKPLVYTLHNNTLLIASTPSALLACGVPPQWDTHALMLALHYQYLPPSKTLFKHIHTLPPAHLLSFPTHTTPHSLPNPKPYWDLNTAPQHALDSNTSTADWTEQLRTLLHDSVAQRLITETPLCLHLSGGLDSSSILALSRDILPNDQPIHAFTVQFHNPTYDETPVAQRSIQHTHNATLHTVDCPPHTLLHAMRDAVIATTGLAINGHLPAKYLLHKAISQRGFKVALTGEGADELLLGYPHLRSDLFNLHQHTHLSHSLQASNQHLSGIMLPQGDTLPTQHFTDTLGFTPSFLRAKASFGAKMRPLLNIPPHSPFQNPSYPAQLFLQPFPTHSLKHLHPVHISRHLWTRTCLSNYILSTLGDPTELAHSVEGRTPFLDHTLFEHTRTLPIHLCIDPSGREKAILREALSPLLTHEVYTRQKRPFISPPLTLLPNGQLHTPVLDALTDPSLRTHPILNTHAIQNLIHHLPSLPTSTHTAYDPILTTLWSIAILHDHFNMT